jgi:hypothetical protein
VIARRAVEARVWVETSSEREASRCPLCAFLTDGTDRAGRHAPDCIAAAGPETERLIRFLEARQENL